MLYGLLGQACMTRDGKAPISLSPAELKELDSYSYIVSLEEDYQKANKLFGRNDPVARRAQVAMRAQRQQVEDRMIAEKRKRYLAKADRLRALGQSVEEAFPNAKYQDKNSLICCTAKAYLAICGTIFINEFMHKRFKWQGTAAEVY